MTLLEAIKGQGLFCTVGHKILDFKSWLMFFFNQQIDDHGPFNDLEILKNKPGKTSASNEINIFFCCFFCYY